MKERQCYSSKATLPNGIILEDPYGLASCEWLNGARHWSKYTGGLAQTSSVRGGRLDPPPHSINYLFTSA